MNQKAFFTKSKVCVFNIQPEHKDLVYIIVKKVCFTFLKKQKFK